MRLSDAIMLGSTTCKMVPGDINSCALGAALNARGVPQDVPYELLRIQFVRYHAAEKLWPWLQDHITGGTYSQMARITTMFDSFVCNGLMTLEQLVDYVRSVEPAEDDSPENGQPVVETALEYAPV